MAVFSGIGSGPNADTIPDRTTQVDTDVALLLGDRSPSTSGARVVEQPADAFLSGQVARVASLADVPTPPPAGKVILVTTMALTGLVGWTEEDGVTVVTSASPGEHFAWTGAIWRRLLAPVSGSAGAPRLLGSPIVTFADATLKATATVIPATAEWIVLTCHEPRLRQSKWVAVALWRGIATAAAGDPMSDANTLPMIWSGVFRRGWGRIGRTGTDEVLVGFDGGYATAPAAAVDLFRV